MNFLDIVTQRQSASSLPLAAVKMFCDSRCLLSRWLYSGEKVWSENTGGTELPARRRRVTIGNRREAVRFLCEEFHIKSHIATDDSWIVVDERRGNESEPPDDLNMNLYREFKGLQLLLLSCV